jgi:hypothetical protein
MSIEGSTHLACSEDVATRFIAYGWNVTRVGDANDLEMLERAFRVFQTTQDRPTLIIGASHIGYGAPHKQDTSAAHGEPLGWAHYTGLRGGHWDAHLWVFCPTQGIAAQVRVYTRKGCQCSKGTTGSTGVTLFSLSVIFVRYSSRLLPMHVHRQEGRYAHDHGIYQAALHPPI